MSSDYGLKLRWDDSSGWETNEKKIFQNTSKLWEELGTYQDGKNTYYDIVRMFKCCNQNGISDLLADLFKRQKKDGQLIDKYKEQIAELNKQLANIYRKLENKSAELENVYGHGLGEKLNKSKEIKNLYEKGYSLRKIGELYHCDKSTVKRLLIKMGVQIRK